MDNIYNFDWLIQEIDNSIIFQLIKDDRVIGVYQVNDILMSTGDKIQVKFSNVNDLIIFINHSIIRFVDVGDSKKIIDIPLRKLYLLFSNSNKILGNNKKKISLKKLDGYAINDGKVVKDNYLVCAHMVNEESSDLDHIMNIAFSFGRLGMQEKIDALWKVNLINYHKENNDYVNRLR